MATIPNNYRDLVEDSNSKGFLILAFLLADGTPLTTPVWFLEDGDHVMVLVAPDSLKAKRLRANPSVAASILEEGKHTRYLSLRGRAEELTDVDNEALYKRLIRKYEGRDPLEITAMSCFRLVSHRIDAFDYSTSEY
jgi:PPOX class probable F420-dependent enzyme